MTRLRTSLYGRYAWNMVMATAVTTSWKIICPDVPGWKKTTMLVCTSLRISSKTSHQ